MTTPLPVLLISPSDETADLLSREIGKDGYQLICSRVVKPSQVRAALESEQWAIAIYDYPIPRFKLADAVKLLRESGLDLPLIALTDAPGQEIVVKAMQAGARDCIDKADLMRLVPAIERELRQAAQHAERRRAEQTVRQLSRAVEQSPASVLITDTSGTIEYVNPKFTEVTGYSVEEIVGQNSRILQSGHMPPEAYKELWDTITSGGEWRGEFHNKKKNGDLYWELASVSSITDEQGQITHFVAVMEDITERKALEAALRFVAARGPNLSGQAFFRSAVTYLSDALKLEVVYIGELTAGEDGQRVRTVALCKEGGIVNDIEYDLAHTPLENGVHKEVYTVPENVRKRFPRDGLLAEMGIESYVGVGLWDSHGDPLGVLVMLGRERLENARLAEALLQLLSVPVAAELERQRAEEALRASEEEFRALTTNLPIGVYRTGADGRILFANPAYAQLSGFDSVEELISSTTATEQFPDPEERKEILARWKEHGTVQKREGILLRRDGTRIWVQDIGRVALTDDGQIDYVEGTLEDITERRQADHLLRESEEKYRNLFDNLLNGFALHEIVTDPDGQPVDYIFLEANHAFEELTGLKADEIVGKRVTEVLPGIENDPFIEIYGRVALTGEPVRFEQYSAPLDRHYDIAAFSPRRGQFATVFSDITQRKRAEEARQQESSVAAALSALYKPLISQVATVDTIASEVLAQARALTDSPHGLVTAIEPLTGLNVCRAHTDFLVSGDHDEGQPLSFSPDEQGRYFGLLGHTLNTREAFFSNAPTQHPAWAGPLKDHPPLERILNVPVILDEELVGQIALANALRDYTQRDLDAIVRLAEFYGLAVQRIRVQAALEQRVSQVALINFISGQVATMLKLEKLLHSAAQLIQVHFGFEHVGLFILDHERGTLHMRARAGVYASRFPEDHQLKVGEGMVGWVAAHGEKLLANDVRAEPRFYNPFSENIIGSELSVPMRHGDEVVGVIDAQSRQANAFDANDILVVETLADEIAIAVENARLYHELEAHSQTLEQAVEKRTQELQQEKEQVEAVMHSAAEAVFITDTRGRVTTINPAFEEQTGYNLNEIGGQSASILNSPASAQARLVERMLATTRAGRPWRGEAILVRKDGSQYDAAMSVAPLHTPGGDVRGYVTVMRDISQLKEVERMKDSFVSSATHELRTPITNLKTHYYLIEKHPQKLDEYLSVLKRETNRLHFIIEDLLRLSRLDQDQVAFKLTPTDLNALAAQYVSDRTPLAETQQLRLVLQEQVSLPGVRGDEGLLGQVLSILLTNAINYTPHGGQVTVGTALREQDGRQWATLSVQDTGPGIAPEEQSEVFNRFYRGEAGRKSSRPGTGLGLAIASEIVERHGGRLKLTSEGVAGKGSQFTLWLPVDKGTRSAGG